MNKTLVILGVVLGASALATSEASAQERFGRQGQFALAAERLTGVVAASERSEVGDTDVTTNITSVYLLANPFNGVITNYSFPRIGFDYLVTNGFTLGASLGYFTYSGSVDVEGDETDLDGASGFLVAPRLGYAAMFSDTVGIWP